MNNNLLRPSTTKRKDGSYAGVLRDAKGKVVWACEHSHRNRDNDEWISQHTHQRSQRSALNCAKIELSERQKSSELPAPPLPRPSGSFPWASEEEELEALYAGQAAQR